MNYAIKSIDNILLVKVDDLLNELENKKVITELKEMINTESNKCIVDLEEVGFMNSVGLNFLISILTTCRKNEGDIVLIHTNQQIIQLLEVTKLSSLFNIQKDLDTALDFFNGK